MGSPACESTSFSNDSAFFSTSENGDRCQCTLGTGGCDETCTSRGSRKSPRPKDDGLSGVIVRVQVADEADDEEAPLGFVI